MISVRGRNSRSFHFILTQVGFDLLFINIMDEDRSLSNTYKLCGSSNDYRVPMSIKIYIDFVYLI